MEAGRESQSLLDQIRPPRLEDAGLEDCALPPDAIREAFLKAASAVRSLVPGSSDGDRCVDDPLDEEEQENSSDALVGITEGVSAPSEGCAAEKGGASSKLPEADDVAVIGGGGSGSGSGEDERSGDLAGVGDLPEDPNQACVDGLVGLEIGRKGRGSLANSDKDGNNNEKGDEKPILAEGYV